jgi:hypothetical protein
MIELGDHRFHPLWLRDNCACPQCRHESGQRLLDTRSLPDDLSVLAVNGYEVAFSDGHTSVFDPDWLQAHAGVTRPRARRLWGAEIQDDLPSASYDEVAAGGGARSAAGSRASTSSVSRFSPAGRASRRR